MSSKIKDSCLEMYRVEWLKAVVSRHEHPKSLATPSRSVWREVSSSREVPPEQQCKSQIDLVPAILSAINQLISSVRAFRKNKKKKKSSTTEKLREEEYETRGSGAEDEGGAGSASGSGERVVVDAGKTEAQRRFEEVQKKRVSRTLSGVENDSRTRADSMVDE